ncbi:hypothetical protein C5E05_15585 [Pseudoclavibacter sp. AY1H1]|nr:hypothetical protein C5E05_15585 [Pseudoclavibacter sp. AY1H1]
MDHGELRALNMSSVPPKPRVLMSYNRPPGGGNPYTAFLAQALADDVDLQFFSWKTALIGRWDIFHLHWPDALVVAPSAVRELLKSFLLVALVLRIRLTRKTLVWTVHNLKPHEAGRRTTAFAIDLLIRAVDVRIYLNSSEDNDLSLGVTVPHGDYVPLLRQHKEGGWASQERVVHQILHFGLVRPYKGIESLIESYDQQRLPGSSLVILGAAKNAQYRHTIQQLADAHPGTAFDARFVEDPELLDQLAESRLVVLPYLQMYNSGALIYALSFGCPVLAPVSSSNLALQREVGSKLLTLYQGPLTGEVLEAAYRDAPARRTSASAFSERRSWATTGLAHVRLYRALRGARAARAADMRARVAAAVAAPDQAA